MRLPDKYHQLELKNRIIRTKLRDIIIHYTDNIDSIVDSMSADDFGDDERFPYFLNIWDSGPVLSEYIIQSYEDLKGKTVLELGSGTGVAGVVIATSGCRIIFSDYEEYSLELCRKNAVANGIKDFKTILGDWREFPDLSEKIDIVVCSDVLYEKKQVIPLSNIVKRFVLTGSTAYISDPGRGHIENFLDILKGADLKTELVYEHKNQVTDLRNIKVYKIYL